MTQGKIKTLKNGFGFIKIDGEEKELFFHANELKNVSFPELALGEALSFDIEEGPKGLNAVNISKI